MWCIHIILVAQRGGGADSMRKQSGVLQVRRWPWPSGEVGSARPQNLCITRAHRRQECEAFIPTVSGQPGHWTLPLCSVAIWAERSWQNVAAGVGSDNCAMTMGFSCGTGTYTVSSQH